MSTNQHKRLAVETPEERERLQWMSTNQHERLAVETPEEERKKITANVSSTTQRLTEQETIRQSIAK